MRLVISMSLYVLVLSSRQLSLSASYISRLRPGLLSLCSVLSSRQILLCSCLVVWLFSCLVVWLSGIVCRFGWKPIPSVARVTRDEVSGLEIRRKELSGRQYLIDNSLSYFDVFACFGTVFQTVVSLCFKYPETSSRVTLASLGVVFQTNLIV